VGCVTTNNLVHPRYNAFAAARSLGFGKLPVVFVDGHCQSPMDDGWDAMFAKVQYIKHLDPGTCFKHMIIIPTGYQAAISTGITPTQNCPATPRVREFGDVFLRSFGIEPLPSCTAEGKHQLTMVMRENYKAHPRHNGRIDTRLRNEKDVLRELQKFAASSDLGALRFVRSCLLLCFVVSLTSPRLSPLFLFFFRVCFSVQRCGGKVRSHAVESPIAGCLTVLCAGRCAWCRHDTRVVHAHGCKSPRDSHSRFSEAAFFCVRWMMHVPAALWWETSRACWVVWLAQLFAMVRADVRELGCVFEYAEPGNDCEACQRRTWLGVDSAHRLVPRPTCLCVCVCVVTRL